MGDRAQIAIKQDGPTKVYLYSHWDGSSSAYFALHHKHYTMQFSGATLEEYNAASGEI